MNIHGTQDNRCNWCGQHVNAEQLNADFIAVLKLALSTIELHTGNGVQNKTDFPLDKSGNVDYEAVAEQIRAAIICGTNHGR